jgi:hypothetical protein
VTVLPPGSRAALALPSLLVSSLILLACTAPIAPTLLDSWGTLEEVTSKQEVRFAVIGDYGRAGKAARDVARVVVAWRPDLVITTGDNNYPRGEAATIDANVGQYYHRFIEPYRGAFGDGARRNRFFPTLGNHDLMTRGGRAYLDYFTLPGNERYYDLLAGPVHFFALNSDPLEPDGTAEGSKQRAWLQERLEQSTAAWQIVYFHHAPYASGRVHSPGTWMRWPFAEWGVDVVFAGHEHLYERLTVESVTYFVVGLGGAPIYRFGNRVLDGSRFRFNREHGALLATATPEDLTFAFATSSGQIVDRYRLPSGRAIETPRGGAS